MEKYLEGKRILFIGIGFYDYDKAIKEEMENAGAIVDYYMEFEKISFKYKILNRVCKKIVENKKKKYQNEIIKNIKEKYDFIFVIRGENLLKDFFINLKQKIKNAKYILYEWDSLAMLKNYQNIKEYFDIIYSFDRIDCIANKEMRFLPLFYREKTMEENIIEKDIDISFIGGYHDDSDRLKILSEVKKKCDEIGLKSFLCIVMSWPRYIKNIASAKGLIVSLKKMEYSKYIDIMNRSRVILDIEHQKQKGLTMRTIEMVANNKKIITTNKDILNYDFYNSSNIDIIERDQIKISKEFIDKEYQAIDDAIIENYNLKNWIKKIFNNN
jgi:hypothetical protein